MRVGSGFCAVFFLSLAVSPLRCMISVRVSQSAGCLFSFLEVVSRGEVRRERGPSIRLFWLLLVLSD